MSHQFEAIDYVMTHENVPLFDEQGLGKSKIVIDALCENIKDNLIDGILIICKKTLLHTWKKEIEKHSHLYAIVIEGVKRQRARTLLTFGQFYIVNYESLIQELEMVTLLLKNKRFAMVLDESQKIKNPNSKISKTILTLRNLAVKRIIITGTPIANRPEDIWCQFYFLDGGELLGNDFISFKNQFHINYKDIQDLSILEDRLNNLKSKINSISIRRTKNVLELPEKIFSNIYTSLAPAQQIIYEKAREEMLCEISSTNGEIIRENIENYLVKLLRLTQIASNPGLINSEYYEIPAKFDLLDQLIKDIISSGEKAIIWTGFTGNVRTLKNRFQKYGAQMLFGEISITDRDIIINKFMTEERYKVLIANPAAAKEGLTLTAANNAIYLDRTFKMDDYLQSQDRIHRISQTKKCKIIKLIAKDTIDEYTDEILEKKELVAKYILGDTKEIPNEKTYFGKEDLLRILGG